MRNAFSVEQMETKKYIKDNIKIDFKDCKL